MKATSASRNHTVDLLRALGALSVTLFHFCSVEQHIPDSPLARAWRAFWLHGHLGVPVFFVLSGYYLVPAWQRAGSAFHFLFHRFRRLFPPYWSSLALIVGLAGWFKLTTGVNSITPIPQSPGAIAATLLMLTAPLTAIPTINWVYWTLTTLLICCLVAALPLLAPKSLRLPVLATVHLLLSAASLFVPRADSGLLFFLHPWPVFALGMAWALRTDRSSAARTFLFTSTFHAMAAIAIEPARQTYLITGILTLGWLFFASKVTVPPLLAPLTKLGKISYSLYLVHVPFGIYLGWRLIPQEPANAAVYIGTQLALLSGVVLAAFLFFLVFERPFGPSTNPQRP